ncbi:MAG: ferrous iron transport protein A [Lachnospiraceae bacterium]|nr:ferrous iron transport protein A [Lachnospiraceae bacterium]
MIPLLLADTGSEQTVQMIKGNDKTKTFVQKMGIVPGAKVTIVASHGGDLIVYVKDVRIALTKEIASRIMV